MARSSGRAIKGPPQGRQVELLHLQEGLGQPGDALALLAAQHLAHLCRHYLPGHAAHAQSPVKGTKPPQIMRLPSKGMLFSHSLKRGSSITFLLISSRFSREG